MAKIKFYVITCSSDTECNERELYIHAGEPGNAHWLPQTARELKARLFACRSKHGCQNCDAEVHELCAERTKITLKQYFNNAKTEIGEEA